MFLPFHETFQFGQKVSRLQSFHEVNSVNLGCWILPITVLITSAAVPLSGDWSFEFDPAESSLWAPLVLVQPPNWVAVRPTLIVCSLIELISPLYLLSVDPHGCWGPTIYSLPLLSVRLDLPMGPYYLPLYYSLLCWTHGWTSTPPLLLSVLDPDYEATIYLSTTTLWFVDLDPHGYGGPYSSYCSLLYVLCPMCGACYLWWREE
jgi:hypothetical protein